MFEEQKIILLNENITETEFSQKEALINFGNAPISTYNLVNCIAIGGIFELPNGDNGTFMTHESPTDFLEQQRKLTEIKKILDEKLAIIKKIILFCIDKPSKSIFINGLTNEAMIDYVNKLFNLDPIIKFYSYHISKMICGKAIISPTYYDTSLIPLRTKTKQANHEIETFIVDVLYNNNNEKIYKCPSCNNITGTFAPKNPHNVSFFSHRYDCLNKNKIPVEK